MSRGLPTGTSASPLSEKLGARGDTPLVWAEDAGVENLNANVDAALAAVARLVVFYVQQHNEGVAHSAFRGHTPDEMFFGTEIELVAGLDERRRTARQHRIQANRNARCGVCPRVDVRPPGGAGE